MRVSVLITTYQHERYIARALDGVLEQRGDVSYEVLVGDDASTDGTREVIAEYARAHPDRLRTFLPERNLGLGGKAIFDELIRLSRGDCIAALDGDDFWTSPDKLALQVAYMDVHPECAMCFHNVIRHHENGTRPDLPYNRPDQAAELTVEELLRWCPVASCSPVFRRPVLDPLPPWYFELPWGDWPLYFLAARHGEIHYLPDVMGVYRIHGEGMYSGQPRAQALAVLTSFYEHLDGVVPAEYETSRSHRLADSWLKRAQEHDRLGERVTARRCLGESLLIRPLEVRRPRRGTGDKERALLWLELRMSPAWRRRIRRRHSACVGDGSRSGSDPR